MTKIKSHWPLLLALLIGFFTRAYQGLDRFIYAHDNDLASWMVKDIVVDKHFRLIGQETSSGGVFIGPLFYYSLIPFYLIGNMDPAPTIAFSWIIGLSAIASIYFVVGRLHGRKAGIIAALFYSASYLIVITEREVVPTTPVMLWSIWAYYAAHLLFAGNRRGLWLAAGLLALVWHINLALILLLPIFAAGVLCKLKNFKTSDFFGPLLLLLLLSSPLIIFEFRHSFLQTRSLLSSFTGNPQKTLTRTVRQKIDNVVTITVKNSTRLFAFNLQENHRYYIPIFLLAVFIALTLTKKLSPVSFFIISAWLLLFIGFFVIHPLNLSEYYLNGINILWLIIASVFLASIPVITPFILALFLYLNLNYFLSSSINKIGYRQKKAIVDFIKQDAAAHNYPCVSVSYMTDEGQQFGYRYFFYLAGVHVNQPKSNSPVYTIVFPHRRANRLDKTFGALGLVLPNYSQYRGDSVKLSCSGQNANLTDPMFGFVN